MMKKTIFTLISVFTYLTLNCPTSYAFEVQIAADDAWNTSKNKPAVTYNSINQEYLVVWEDLDNSQLSGKILDLGGNIQNEIVLLSGISGRDVQDLYAIFNPDLGKYLVVWTENSSSGQHDIWGRHIEADGNLGSYIKFVDTDKRVEKPVVVYNPTRQQYLVVVNYIYSSSDCNIRYQRFDTNGNPQTGLYNFEASVSNERNPVAAYSSVQERYMIAWQEDNSGTNAIKACWMDWNYGTGGSKSSQFNVSSSSTSQTHPQIAYNGVDDKFLIAWVNHHYIDIDGAIIDSSGNMVKSQFIIHGGGINYDPDIAYNSSTHQYKAVYQYLTGGIVENFSQTPYQFKTNYNAIITDFACKLTSASTNQWGSVISYNTQPETDIPPDRIYIGFNFKIGGGTGADGMSMALMDSTLHSSSELMDENGPYYDKNGTVVVTLDTFDHSIGTGYNVIRISQDGTQIAEFTPTFDLNDNDWRYVKFEYHTEGSNAYVSMRAGSDTVFEEVKLNTPLANPVHLGFGARTGALADEHWVDGITFMSSEDADIMTRYITPQGNLADGENIYYHEVVSQAEGMQSDPVIAHNSPHSYFPVWTDGRSGLRTDIYGELEGGTDPYEDQEMSYLVDVNTVNSGRNFHASNDYDWHQIWGLKNKEYYIDFTSLYGFESIYNFAVYFWTGTNWAHVNTYSKPETGSENLWFRADEDGKYLVYLWSKGIVLGLASTYSIGVYTPPSVHGLDQTLQKLGETEPNPNVIHGSNFTPESTVSMLLDAGNQRDVLSKIYLPMNSYHTATASGRLWLTSTDDGLDYYSLNDPDNPAWAGTLSLGGKVHTLISDGTYLYAACDDGSSYKLKKINASTLAVTTSAISLTSAPIDMTINGGLLFILTADEVFIFNSSSLSFIRDFDHDIDPVLGYPIVKSITAYSTLVYVLSSSSLTTTTITAFYHNNGFMIPRTVQFPNHLGVDFTLMNASPIGFLATTEGIFTLDFSLFPDSDPGLIQEITLDGQPSKLLLTDDRCFVAGYYGFSILDITDPVNINKIGFNGIPKGVSLSVEGNILYLSNSDKKLYVVDVSTPSLYQAVGRIGIEEVAPSFQYFEGLAVSDYFTHINDFIYTVAPHYMGNGAATLIAINKSDPYNLSHAGLLDIQPGVSTFFWGMTASPNESYLAMAYGQAGIYIQYVDGVVSNRWYNPPEFSGVKHILTDGSAMWVADNSGVFQYTVSPNGSSVTVTPEFSYTGTGDFSKILEATDTHVFATRNAQNDLLRINRSNQNDVKTWTFPTPKLDYNLWKAEIVNDNQLVLLHRYGEFTFNKCYVSIYEISGDDLVLLNRSEYEYPNLVNCLIKNDTVYLSSSDGMTVIDITDPLQQVVLGTQKAPAVPLQIGEIDDFLYFFGEYGLVSTPKPKKIETTYISPSQLNVTIPSPPLDGHYTLSVHNGPAYSDLKGAITFTDVDALLTTKAIIVAGTGPTKGGTTNFVWDMTMAYANNAHDNLRFQGYSNDDIYYIEGVGSPGASTVALYNAITGWANNPDTSELLIYLIGHGDSTGFDIQDGDPLVQWDTLSSWLDQLQGARSGLRVIVVVDACESGGAVTGLVSRPILSSDDRLIMTSSMANRPAYFLSEKQSFSAHFWSAFSGRNGEFVSMEQAFTNGHQQMAGYQAALVDANNNGLTNEPEDFTKLAELTGQIYATRRAYDSMEYTRPVVGSVDVPFAITTASTTITAYDVADPDGGTVTVWAVVTPPGHDTSLYTDIPVHDLPPSTTIEDDEPTRVQLFSPGGSDYGQTILGLDWNGTYLATVYAEDEDGLVSPIKTTYLTRTGGSELPAPDIYDQNTDGFWDDDDSPHRAYFISINHPVPQHRNFHEYRDVDYVRLHLEQGQLYKIRAKNLSPVGLADWLSFTLYNNSSAADVLSAPNPVPEGDFDETGQSATEKYFIWRNNLRTGDFFLKMDNTSSSPKKYGATVRYDLEIFVPEASVGIGLPSTIEGGVLDAGSPLEEASVNGLIAGKNEPGSYPIKNSDGDRVYTIVTLKSGSIDIGAVSQSYQQVVPLIVPGVGDGIPFTGENVAMQRQNQPPTGNVSIAGSVVENQTLTASHNLTDPDGLGSVSYQWRRNGTSIGGATSNTYTLGDNDVGTVISVVASYTDGHGTLESVASNNTVPVQNINDAPTGNVSIAGSVVEDQTLTASHNLTDPDGLGSVSYQWRRNGTSIGGATSTAYTLGDNDVGKVISVVVSYTDGHGTLESVASNNTVPVQNINDAPTGSVSIAGSVVENQTLTASHNLTDPDGLGSVSYQWRRNGTSIGGATSTTYTLGDNDVGRVISVVASYTDGHGTLESVASNNTVPVQNINDAPAAEAGTYAPANEGTRVDLTGVGLDIDPGASLTYLWEQIGNGPAVTLINPTSPNSWFMAPDVITDGTTLTFKLTVGDGLAEASDTCSVNILWVPAVSAGSDNSVKEREKVQFSGSADPGGTISWSQVDNGAPPVSPLNGSDTLTPDFTAPNVAPGTPQIFEFRLTVTYSDRPPVEDSCQVTVEDIIEDQDHDNDIDGKDIASFSQTLAGGGTPCLLESGVPCSIEGIAQWFGH